MKELKDYVRTIPNFPEEGIMFRDITSVLQDPDGFKLAIDEMMDLVKDLDFDVVCIHIQIAAISYHICNLIKKL